GGRTRVDRTPEHARADRHSFAGAEAGADAQVRLQLLERRGGLDPRQDRRRGEIAPTPRARLPAEADRVKLSPVLEVGIVGLPGSGRSTLLAALTGAHGLLGVVPIPDERLEAVARIEGSAKVTPAALEVVDVPGTGPALLGNLRKVDALLGVVDGFSGTRDSAADREVLLLELVVAD